MAAHFRYISKKGSLDIEDERGETMRGKGSRHQLADDWRPKESRTYGVHTQNAKRCMPPSTAITSPLM